MITCLFVYNTPMHRYAYNHAPTVLQNVIYLLQKIFSNQSLEQRGQVLITHPNFMFERDKKDIRRIV